MLRLFLNETNNYNKGILAAEVNYMRQAIEDELTSVAVINSMRVDTVLYANKRYWIPFGWWSNPIPSLASTSWAALFDNRFNPFYLGGLYKTYELVN